MINRRSLRRNCIAAYASYAIDRSIDRLFCLRRSAAYTIDRRRIQAMASLRMRRTRSPRVRWIYRTYSEAQRHQLRFRSVCSVHDRGSFVRSARFRTRSIGRSSEIDRSVRSVRIRSYEIDRPSCWASALHMLRIRSMKLWPYYDRSVERTEEYGAISYDRLIDLARSGRYRTIDRSIADGSARSVRSSSDT